MRSGTDVVLAAPVAPLAAHPLLVFLTQVTLLLLAALLLGRLARRLGMPAIVGELSAGVLFGPTVLAHLVPSISDWLFPPEIEQLHLLDAAAQLGVLLLVGFTGVDLDIGMIRRRGTTVLRISLAGFLLPLGLGVGLGLLLPADVLSGGEDRATFALFLGVTMCVSAIPVIAKTLSDMRLLHRNIGQLTLGAGMVDDALGWFMLSVVSAMATGAVRAHNVALSLMWLAVVLVGAWLVGRPLVRWILRQATRGDDAAPAVAASAIIIVACSACTHAMGLEALFGAFVGGVLIGTSGVEVNGRIAALRTAVFAVLAPLFFATAGLRIDLSALGRPVVLFTGIVVLLTAIVGKFAGAYIGALTSRLNRWEALALGAGMNARGVVEVVVAMTGLRLGVLNVASYTIVVLVAIVTSVMAPPILRYAMARVEHTGEEELRLRGGLAYAAEQQQQQQQQKQRPQEPQQQLVLPERGDRE
ncbi:cation:proton antiporter [Streptomyces sp. NPDC059894]|uniref:cation:proton antiporter n=1 Tax=unclassified Streptomyces TaxID=2593676 RepID=UPI00364FFBCA